MSEEEPHEKTQVYNYEKRREDDQWPEVEHFGSLHRPERAHNRVPHAQQTHIEDAYDCVLVEYKSSLSSICIRMLSFN